MVALMVVALNMAGVILLAIFYPVYLCMYLLFGVGYGVAALTYEYTLKIYGKPREWWIFLIVAVFWPVDLYMRL